MNYLQMVQHVCRKYGQPPPTTVVGNLMPMYALFNALVVEAADELRTPLQPFLRIRRLANLSPGGSFQGLVTTLFGPMGDLDRIVPGTLWNNTRRRPFIGPLSPQDWQLTQANPTASAETYYIIMRDELLVWPAPTSADQISCIVQTKYLFRSVPGGVDREYPLADTDVFLLEDALLRLQLEWRWLRAKEKPFEDVKEAADAAIADEVLRLNGAPTLNLAPEVPQVKPGIWIPVGSWNV